MGPSNLLLVGCHYTAADGHEKNGCCTSQARGGSHEAPQPARLLLRFECFSYLPGSLARLCQRVAMGIVRRKVNASNHVGPLPPGEDWWAHIAIGTSLAALQRDDEGRSCTTSVVRPRPECSAHPDPGVIANAFWEPSPLHPTLGTHTTGAADEGTEVGKELLPLVPGDAGSLTPCVQAVRSVLPSLRPALQAKGGNVSERRPAPATCSTRGNIPCSRGIGRCMCGVTSGTVHQSSNS